MCEVALSVQVMILEVSWDSLWTLSFGLSRFHGHGSWLVCEVALSTPPAQIMSAQAALEAATVNLKHSRVKLYVPMYIRAHPLNNIWEDTIQ